MYRHSILAFILLTVLLTIFVNQFGSPVPPWDPPPQMLGVTKLSIGRNFSCALDKDGRAFCWGANRWGQLGSQASGDHCRILLEGRVRCTTLPTPVETSLRWIEIAAGSEHTCAIAVNREVYCWGRNTKGQTGVAVDSSPLCMWAPRPVRCSRVPTRVPSNDSFASISVGESLSCAITDSRVVLCWGGEHHNDSHLPWEPIPGVLVQQIEVIGDIGCGLDLEGTLHCWSADAQSRTGMLGSPVPFKTFSLGGRHGCALDYVGHAWCWGWNSAGALGLGMSDQFDFVIEATSVAFDIDFESIVALMDATCGLTRNGQLYCWGRNHRRHLLSRSTDRCPGIDSDDPCNLQPTLASAPRFASINAYPFSHACGTTSDGTVFCWGPNQAGQFGNGTRRGSRHPVAVLRTPK
jgi:alpha-tubulin suppressor-like RCC1 family protein